MTIIIEAAVMIGASIISRAIYEGSIKLLKKISKKKKIEESIVIKAYW